MMKKEDIYKDEFIKELMKDAKLEEPSDRFTNQVMDNVMQDWLAKPIEVKKPISRKQWIGMIGVLFLLTLVVLGTDVRTLISDLNHPFFNQLDAILLKPLNQMLNSVFLSLKKLPIMVYIVVVAMASLAAFDRVVNKLIQFR
ncbi:hypothetical protein GCQ56_10850 [Marinifilum sp. N1E240]|uniref:hypothetical protein n=1 Tax=Marinifilum sp. N1E240 TaxID=2608082 RepID=UPI00128DD366|nr:hypothetical protein [Marinifilum sp. N1E240]MPQ47502.1 hypothetical protein [Marinifilum sp. N1E240]